MNESKQNKIWELTASKVHNEADPTEKKELEKLLKHPENRKIYDDVNNFHRKIPKTETLVQSSPKFRKPFLVQDNTVLQ